MSKYVVTFSDSKVTLTDKAGKAVDFSFETAMPLQDAINETKHEQAKRGAVARAHLSILCAVLDTSRTDAYKGKTPIGDKLPNEFKSAVREAETQVMQKDFVAALVAKKNTQEQAFAAWDSYIGQLRDGMYARYKATASIYYAYFGLLPCVYENGHPDKSRLLSVTAMEKIIANAKTDLAQEENEGISLSLAKVAHDLRSRTEKTHIGDIQRAIDNLNEMLATFTGLKRESDMAATESHMAIVDSKVEKQSREKKLVRSNSVPNKADALIARAAAILENA